jgi:hypothetical protein
MTSERASLYNALEKAIGRAPTRLLMERIDAIDEMAIRADLEDLREYSGGFDRWCGRTCRRPDQAFPVAVM